MLQNVFNLSLITLLMYSSNALCQTAGVDDDLANKLNAISKTATTLNTAVLTGPQEAQANVLRYDFDTVKAQINSLNSTLSNYQKANAATELTWSAPSNKDLLNASANSDVVNICRAAFVGIGASVKAVYPGQLTTSGCQISYAGYAFLMTDYQVLAGKSDKTQWMSVATLNKLMEEKASSKLPPTSQIRQQPPFTTSVIIDHPQPGTLIDFLASADPNGAIPLAISGGYESNLPVFICRATYEGKTKIGKLIAYDTAAYTKQNACDIGVGSKEVTVGADYELLVVKK